MSSIDVTGIKLRCPVCGKPMLHTAPSGEPYCGFTDTHPERLSGAKFDGVVLDDVGEPDNVVRLVPREPMVRENVVEHLEKLLEYARNGELESIATACVWSDRTTSYGFTANECYSQQLGAIARLQHQYIEANE